MALKYSKGKAGSINYEGRRLTVFVYANEQDFIKEVNQLGRYLDEDVIAWVGSRILIYRGESVGTTTAAGEITWHRPVSVDYLKPARGKRREMPIVEEGAQEALPIVEDLFNIDTKSLWKGVENFDWSAIML